MLIKHTQSQSPRGKTLNQLFLRDPKDEYEALQSRVKAKREGWDSKSQYVTYYADFKLCFPIIMKQALVALF